MSLSNILAGPNTYDLFCRSINTTGSNSPTTMTYDSRYLNSDQSINTSTSTIINFNTQIVPPITQPALPYTYSNGVFTITRDGVVIIPSVQVKWDPAGTTGDRIVALRTNSNPYSIVQNSLKFTALGSGGSHVMSLSGGITLNTGNTFQFLVFQNNGTPLNIQGAITSPNAFTSISIVSLF